MRLLDIFEDSEGEESLTSNATGLELEKDDQTPLKLTDVRKTRLTLNQINQLRQMHDIRKLEHAQKLGKLEIMYAPAEPDQGM